MTYSSNPDNEKEIAIVIIEDNPYMRESWNTILDFEKDMRVIAVYNSCEEALSDSKLALANIVLLDINLPGISGTEGLKSIRELNPEAAIIMATIHQDDDHIYESLSKGAIGYLQKKVSASELITAVRSAHEGGSPMSPVIARKVINSFFYKQPPSEDDENTLNEKEQQVLKYLAEGLNYAAIGSKMHLSVNGVGYYIRNIYRKLEVNSRSEAVREGLKKRIINFFK